MRIWLVCAVAVAGLGWYVWMRPAPRVVTAASPDKMTVLVMLGEKAKSVEKWDGTAKVEGAAILDTLGWHFSDGDAVSGPGAWKAVTRRDAVAQWADIHYTEMRPGSTPEVLFHPIGLFLTISMSPAARIQFDTAQGSFGVSAAELGETAKPYLDGRVTARIVPSAEKLSGANFEDDEPAIAVQADGSAAVAWVAYRDRADRVLLRTRSGSGWTAAEEVTKKPGDIFRCSVVTAGSSLWVFWSEREDRRWHIWGREKRGGEWREPVRVSSDGSNTFHRAAASSRGYVFVAWQSYRGGQSDIYMRPLRGGAWGNELKLSESGANDWEPAIAAGSDGSVHVAWDSYANGNYDVYARSWRDGKLEPLRQVTSSPLFQAHVSVAADAAGKPWVAWNESGVNWGKDQGFLIPVPLATPLHQERWLRVAAWDGGAWREPAVSLKQVFGVNAEHPIVAFDGGGNFTMIFRKFERRNHRTIGSPIVWENFVTRFDGASWTAPRPLANSGSWAEKHSGLARDPDGELWAAWMTDNRPFATMIPGNSDVYCARLGKGSAADMSRAAMRPFAEEFAEEIAIHNSEPADVKAIRAYPIRSQGKQYKIYRGDMHRHTDFSQDFKYDGSLLEVYRYALDAAGFDYIAPTDHQGGYDQEYSWWQNQKLVDLFLVGETFLPLFAYERSLPFPNGHRNVVWSYRGVRTLPIPEAERTGIEGAKKLFAHLKQTNGISMPHSSATDQGTDWRDNDREVEPLVEIYQGYRNSYEYEGAPKAASELNPHAQKSGWRPQGFWWNALDKGYKLGVQASSDHWSTHISYACLLTETPSREGLLDAIRKRHAYAATDNIVMDFRADSGGKTYIMGDAFDAASAPRFTIHAGGTATIKRVEVIKNKKFVYTSRPLAKQADFTFTDKDFGPGESWYYVRVMQDDGQMAWSSPIWVNKR